MSTATKQTIITTGFSINIGIALITYNWTSLGGWICALIWATAFYIKERENINNIDTH